MLGLRSICPSLWFKRFLQKSVNLVVKLFHYRDSAISFEEQFVSIHALVVIVGNISVIYSFLYYLWSLVQLSFLRQVVHVDGLWYDEVIVSIFINSFELFHVFKDWLCGLYLSKSRLTRLQLGEEQLILLGRLLSQHLFNRFECERWNLFGRKKNGVVLADSSSRSEVHTIKVNSL